MISSEPWHVDPQVYHSLQSTPQKSSYILVDGGSGDYQKVTALYQKSPIKGYVVGKIQVIYNSALARQFEGKVMVLNERANSSAFDPKWHQGSDLDIRQRTHQALSKITIKHKSTYSSVQLYPAFHGTKAALIDSIFKTGFANLATTDNGFFGKGLYNTQYAEYAHRVYSDGTLLFNWVAFYSAYPVTLTDMTKLQGSANYSNYDAHYVLTAPRNPHNPNEVVYYPITQGQNPTYDELVVFDSAHILPRYLITLAPDLMHLQSLSSQATGVTLMTAISSYFSEAPTTLQPLLQKELVALTSQLTTPLNFASLSLLTLIERSKGEADPTIKLHLANKIAKALEDSTPIPSLPSVQPAPAPKALKEIRTLREHESSVYALTQLADGTFASGSGDKTIKIWNPTTGSCIQTLQGHTSSVFALAELADGSFAGSSRNTIKILNPKTGSCIQTLKGHTRPVSDLVQLTDGTLASGSWDHTIKIWNPKTGSCIQTLQGHTHGVFALVQLANGSLASGSSDSTIKIWNPKTSACTHTLQGHIDDVRALVLLADGSLASGSIDRTIKIWNPKTGSCIQTLQGHTEAIFALVQLANGTLASGSKDKTIKIWNLTTGSCIQTLQGHTESVFALVQLANGALASGSGDSTIRIWG